MRVIATTLTCLLFTLCTSGQNKVSIFAGPQMVSANYKVKGVKQETSYKFGFQAGIAMKTPFEGFIYFHPAVFYSLKGYDVNFSQPSFPPDTTALNNSVTLHTLELAPLLQFDLGTGPTHTFFRAGPSFDIQMFGKEQFDLKAGGSVSQNMKFDFASYGRFSFNVLLQFGVETSGFMIYAQYSHGLSSINNFDGGPQIKHRGFGVNIVKFLNSKKIVMDTRNKE